MQLKSSHQAAFSTSLNAFFLKLVPERAPVPEDGQSQTTCKHYWCYLALMVKHPHSANEVVVEGGFPHLRPGGNAMCGCVSVHTAPGRTQVFDYSEPPGVLRPSRIDMSYEFIGIVGTAVSTPGAES